MAKELIIMPNWIGDCALALSVIHRKITMQHTSIFLLVPQPLVQLCGILCGHSIIPYKRSTRAEYRETLRQVKEARFDSVYVLPPSFSSALFALRTGIKKRRGIGGELRGFLLTQTLPRSIRNSLQHLTYEYAMALETDYVPPEYWQGIKIDKTEKYGGRIVFCPGSMYGPAKRWGGFAELAGLLHGKEIVVLGDVGDADAAEAIESAVPDRVTNLTGTTTIAEAARIISAAKVVVSNDSGLMHLAGYMGTPVVGIFGSTSPSWTRPLGSKVRIAHVKIKCSPCFGRSCRYRHYHCLSQITADNVLGLVHQLVQDRV